MLNFADIGYISVTLTTNVFRTYGRAWPRLDFGIVLRNNMAPQAEPFVNHDKTYYITKRQMHRACFVYYYHPHQIAPCTGGEQFSVM